MIRLSTFREHCAAMATAEHKPDCPSLTAKKPFWQHWALTEDGHGMRWRGPEPPWEPPTCDGCNPEADRALFAQMAAEVRAYEQERSAPLLPLGDSLTCPVCGQSMPSRRVNGEPRKVCSTRCGSAWGRQHRKVENKTASEAAHLLAAGESSAVIAQRLGVKPTSVARALRRAGRHDLARAFEASAITGRVWGPNYRYAKEAS